MLNEGYAINTVNRKLSCVRSFAGLAERAGVIPADDSRLISTVAGYSRKEGRNVDADRPQKRRGYKKEKNVSLTLDQVRELKNQPDTPQGRRDAVIICVLADQGLRVGELAALQTSAFNLKEGTFTFYRQKVGITQTHEMTAQTARAIRAWLEQDANALGPLLRASRRGSDNLTHAGMTEQSITRRVRELGRKIGVNGLGSHDLRHYWATDAAKSGTSIEILISAGGWTGAGTALRYIDTGKIANKGIRQSR